MPFSYPYPNDTQNAILHFQLLNEKSSESMVGQPLKENARI